MKTCRMRLVFAWTASVAVLLVAPIAAHANAFQSVFADYQADGAISACSHSIGELQAAQGQIPNDIEQYAPDFPGALAGAIAAHARGDCEGKKATPVPAPSATTPAPPAFGRLVLHQPPHPPKLQRAAGLPTNAAGELTAPATKRSLPAPILLLAIFGGLLAIGGAAVALARYLGMGGDRLAPIGQAFGEAGLRVSSGVEGAFDRLRVRPSRR